MLYGGNFGRARGMADRFSCRKA